MWWTMKGMIRVAPALAEWTKREGKRYFMTMQVHDEIVFDFPKGRGLRPWMTNLPKIKEIKRLLELGGDDLSVPTPVGIEYHPMTWNEGMTIQAV